VVTGEETVQPGKVRGAAADDTGYVLEKLFDARPVQDRTGPRGGTREKKGE